MSRHGWVEPAWYMTPKSIGCVINILLKLQKKRRRKTRLDFLLGKLRKGQKKKSQKAEIEECCRRCHLGPLTLSLLKHRFKSNSREEKCKGKKVKGQGGKIEACLIHVSYFILQWWHGCSFCSGSVRSPCSMARTHSWGGKSSPRLYLLCCHQTVDTQRTDEQSVRVLRTLPVSSNSPQATTVSGFSSYCSSGFTKHTACTALCLSPEPLRLQHLYFFICLISADF